MLIIRTSSSIFKYFIFHFGIQTLNTSFLHPLLHLKLAALNCHTQYLGRTKISYTMSKLMSMHDELVKHSEKILKPEKEEE